MIQLVQSADMINRSISRDIVSKGSGYRGRGNGINFQLAM
jgi:hypothetical protein